MNEFQIFDALIMVTPEDYTRLRNNYRRLCEFLPARRILFVGNEKVGKLVRDSNLGDKADFVREDSILPFTSVHEVIKDIMADILDGQELPGGITGWYYQQFLKMQYARICGDAYYLVWDGDTIPCRKFEMFQPNSYTPYLDLKKEYHEEYFTTLARILPGMRKSIEKSFISEHMLINCEIMKCLIRDIECNQNIAGSSFCEKILRSIGPSQIQKSGFSEFETYGTYVCNRCPDSYRIRNWYSFRLGGCFFDPDIITDEDYEWLGHDFYAISFEKGHTVREDHQNLFSNPQYQKKLSARQMLEIAQEEYKEGYLEMWDET